MAVVTGVIMAVMIIMRNIIVMVVQNIVMVTINHNGHCANYDGDVKF